MGLINQLITEGHHIVLRGNLFPLPARQILGTSCWHVAIGEKNTETKPHKPTNGHVIVPKHLCFYIAIYNNRDMLTELHGFDIATCWDWDAKEIPGLMTCEPYILELYWLYFQIKKS